MISFHIQNKEKNKQRNTSKNKGQDRIVADVSDERLYLNYLSIFKIDRIPKLYLSHNMLRSLKGIEQFKSLRILHLKFNFIAEFEEIDRIVNKFYLKSLNLKGNPIMKIEKNLLTYNYLKANIFENLSLFNSDEPDPPNQMSQQQYLHRSGEKKNLQSRNLDEREIKTHRFIKEKGEFQRGGSSSNIKNYNEQLQVSKCSSQKQNLHMRHQSSSSVLQENQSNAEKQIANALNDVSILLNKTNSGIQNYLQSQQLINSNKNNFTYSSKTTPNKKRGSSIINNNISGCQNQIDASILNKSSSKFINNNEITNLNYIKQKIQQQNKILEDYDDQQFDNLNQQSECPHIDYREVYENDISTIESGDKYLRNEITPCRRKSIAGDQYAEISEIIQSEREKSLENIRQLKKNVNLVQQNLQNLQKNIESQKNIEQIVLNMSSVQSQLSTTHKLTSNALKSSRHSEVNNLQNSIISNGNYTSRVGRQQSAHFFQQNPSQTSISNNINSTMDIDSTKKTQNRMSNNLQLVINHQKQFSNPQYKQSSKINAVSDQHYADEDIPLIVDEQLNQTLQKSKSYINQQYISDSQSVIQPEQFHEALSQRNRKILAESISNTSGLKQNLHKYLDAELLVTTPSSSRRSNSFIKQADNKILRFCEQQQITPKSSKLTNYHNGISSRNINKEAQSQVLKDINYDIDSKSLKIPNSGNSTKDIIKKQQYNISMINQHLEGKNIQKQQSQVFNSINNKLQSEDYLTQREINQYNTKQSNIEKENVLYHMSYSPNINELQQHMMESPKLSQSPKILKKTNMPNSSEIFSLIQKQNQHNMDTQKYQVIVNSQPKNAISKIPQQQQFNNYCYQNNQNNSNSSQLNLNRINPNNYQILQQYIPQNFNDQSGSQSSRMTSSKSQYIQSKRNLGDSNIYREQNSSNQNSIVTYTKNNNNQRSQSYTQDQLQGSIITQQQYQQQQQQNLQSANDSMLCITPRDVLSYSSQGIQGNYTGQNYANVKNNDENIQSCSQQALQTPLKLSYSNIPQQNNQDANLSTFNQQQSGMVNVQKYMIQQQNFGQNPHSGFSYHQMESDNLTSSGINPFQQQIQNNNSYNNQIQNNKDLQCQKISQFGQIQNEMIGNQQSSRTNHNNQKVGGLLLTIGGLQQSMNNTVTSNFADQLLTSFPNTDRFNQIRNSLSQQTQVKTKSSINLEQNNFTLTSAEAVGDLPDIYSPSSQTNQIIHVNQILSDQGNQHYGIQNQNAISSNALRGSDLKNKQRNFSSSSDKQQINIPFENIQINLNKNSQGQFKELIHVQDKFTLQDHKNRPQQVIEVDEDQYSQSQNQHSFENITKQFMPQNNTDDENDNQEADQYQLNSQVNQRQKSKSTFSAAGHRNQQQFSRLNTFSQNEHEIQEDNLSTNNINCYSNQIYQQNSANKNIPANYDVYSNMTAQQNQLIQSKQLQQSQSQQNFQQLALKQQQPIQIIQMSTPLKASYVSQTQNQLSARQSSQNLLSVRKMIEETSDLSIRRQKQQILSGSSQNLVDKHIDDIDIDIYNLSTKYYNRNLLNKVFKTLKTSIQSTVQQRRDNEQNQKSLMFYYRALKVKAFYSWKSYQTTKQNYKRAIQKINQVKEFHHSSGQRQQQ